MSSEILTQDEVDVLLKGVPGEHDVVAAPAAAGAVRECNLAAQEHIAGSRLPTLETVNERFSRLLRTGLFNFMRRSAEIAAGPVRLMKYGDFIGELAIPSSVNVVQVKPLRGQALFVLDPSLVFLVVDNLFGGDGRFTTNVEGREFTPTEHRIIRRILQVIFADCQTAWQSVHPLSFELVRSETDTQFATVAMPTDVVVVTRFGIKLGGSEHSFHICIPYATLEPIRGLLSAATQGDSAGPDRRWASMLTQQVQIAEVDLVADLTDITLTVNQVLNMKVGDVLPAEIPAAVTARVDGVPVFECGFGATNGRYALRIDRVLKPDDDNRAGVRNG